MSRLMCLFCTQVKLNINLRSFGFKLIILLAILTYFFMNGNFFLTRQKLEEHEEERNGSMSNSMRFLLIQNKSLMHGFIFNNNNL